jgi:dynein heavy chain
MYNFYTFFGLDRYDHASFTKDGLAKKAEDSEVKLQRAVRLIGRLDGECRRWSLKVNELNARRKNLVGDTILASGIVAYLGSFSTSIRCKFISEWQKSFSEIGLPYSTHFSLLNFYTSSQDIKAWAAAGLPPDDHSMENAIIVSNSFRPLVIVDPQKQVSKWIGSIEDPQNLSILDINSSEILEEARSSTSTGKVVLVEDVGNETHPGLLKQIISLPMDGKRRNMNCMDSEWTEQDNTSDKRLRCGCILLAYEQGFNYSDHVSQTE